MTRRKQPETPKCNQNPRALFTVSKYESRYALEDLLLLWKALKSDDAEGCETPPLVLNCKLKTTINFHCLTVTVAF